MVGNQGVATMETSVSDESTDEWLLSVADDTTVTTATLSCGCETIAKFTSENPKARSPAITSASVGNYFCAVAIDNLLAVIFEREDVCCTKFKSKINDIAIIDGGYIAVGEQSGIISIGVLGEDNIFSVKQSLNVIAGVSDEMAAFVGVVFQVTEESETKSTALVACLLSDGHLMVCSQIVLEDRDIDFSSVKMDRVAVEHSEAFDVLATKDCLITVGSGPNCMAVYSLEDDVILEDTASLDNEVDMVKIQAVSNGNVYITLDRKGTFYVWDSLTLTVVHTLDRPGVMDFKIVELKADSDSFFSLEDIKLTVLQPDGIQTLTLPSLTTSFECGGRADSTKLSKSLPTQDEVYVTECSTIEDDCDVETIVYFRCYAETSPQKRLLQLIAKKRYEEAEQFATLYGLSYNLDPVIVQSKMRMAKETFEETVEHIMKCKQQLLKHKTGDSSVQEVMAELQELEYRLETYKLVYGEENYSPLEWELFQYENPLTMCSQMLKEDAEKAFTLWRCFQNDIEKQLVPGLIQQILQRMPDTVSFAKVSEWLGDAVIQCVVDKDPGAVNSIVQWTEDQVMALELKNQGSWLMDAIQVCETLLKCLEEAVKCCVDDISEKTIDVIKSRMKCKTALIPLRNLVKLLHSLHELKTKYKCHLTLDVLKQETQESIVFRMLDRVVTVDTLQATLTKQILPYIRNNELIADEVFAKYVQDVIVKSVSCCIQYPWEDRVKAIIRMIEEPEEKVTAVLNLVENVSLPIPEFIEGLVKEVLDTVKHPKTALLKEKWSIKEADNILFSYGLRCGDIRSTFQVKETARFIIANGGSFNDAQKVLSAHKVSAQDWDLPQFWCRLLTERNQIEDLLDYLKSLPKGTAVKCYNFLSCIANNMMVDGEDLMTEAMNPVRLQYFEASIRASHIAMSNTEDIFEKNEISSNTQSIRTVRDLELQFNIYVNRLILADKEKCRDIFFRLTEILTASKLRIVAKLLNLNAGETVSVVSARAAERSSNPEVGTFLRHLSKVCLDLKLPDAFQYSVVTKLCSQEAVTTDSCLQLAHLVLAHCNTDAMMKAIELCKIASLMTDAFKACEDHSSSKKQVTNVGDNIYQEKSSNLQSDMILPDLTQVVSDMIFTDENLELWEQLESVVDYLSREGQAQLGLRTLFTVLSSAHSAAVSAGLAENQIYMSRHDKVLEKARKISALLIPKILDTVPLDGQLALAHVLALPVKQGISLLQSVMKACGSNYLKLKRVNTVATATAEVFGDEKLIDSCQRVKFIAKWGNRFSKINIPFKSGSLSNVAEARQGIDKLIENPHCTVSLINEYFSDFNLEASQLDRVLMSFFDICLTKHCDNDLDPAMLRKAKEVLCFVIGDTEAMLKKVLAKANSYNYELLKFLLEEIQLREDNAETDRGLKLLRRLQLYTRCAPPTSIELRQAVEGEELELDLLPDISSTRLPYHHLMGKQRLEVILAELNPQTLSLWLDMASIISIPRNAILMKTVSNLIGAYVQSSKSPSSSSAASSKVSQEFLNFLGQVANILSQVDNKEMALCCCHSMLDKLKHVGERTVALQCLVSFANKWLNSADELQEKAKAQKVVDVYSKKLQAMSTHWTLCKSGLQGNGELRKLVKQPEELIQKLYTLPDVLDSVEEDKKNINGLCDEIADQHKLSLLNIRISLLDKWLLGISSIIDPDQTMTFDVIGDEADSEEENLQRALYVMKSRDREKCLEHVASIATAVSMGNPRAQQRALYCVLKTGSEEETSTLLKLFNAS